MTFNEFKKDFRIFLESSSVNLGRKTAKTRNDFIEIAMTKLDEYQHRPISKEKKEKKKEVDSMNDRVMRIKPKDRRQALDIGKGVASMTASQSALADEQLGRSPYVNKEKGKDDE